MTAIASQDRNVATFRRLQLYFYTTLSLFISLYFRDEFELRSVGSRVTLVSTLLEFRDVDYTFRAHERFYYVAISTSLYTSYIVFYKHYFLQFLPPDHSTRAFYEIDLSSFHYHFDILETKKFKDLEDNVEH